mgnify:CR=1 FL=1
MSKFGKVHLHLSAKQFQELRVPEFPKILWDQLSQNHQSQLKIREGVLKLSSTNISRVMVITAALGDQVVQMDKITGTISTCMADINYNNPTYFGHKDPKFQKYVPSL